MGVSCVSFTLHSSPVGILALRSDDVAGSREIEVLINAERFTVIRFEVTEPQGAP